MGVRGLVGGEGTLPPPERLICRSFVRQITPIYQRFSSIHDMALIRKVILFLLVIVVVAAVVALPFVGEAQRMIILMGAGLGVLNLLGLLYFLRKNDNGRSPRP